jgi:hypothetical protein
MAWHIKTETTLLLPLTEIFVPKREVTEEWKKLRNVELHNMYYSSNIVTELRKGGYDGWNIQHT